MRATTAVTFLLEQHVGHRTYAENLRRVFPSAGEQAAEWVPVEYDSKKTIWRHAPLPAGLQAALAGRGEVRRGIRSSPADVHVFNTQVPVALGGRLARSRPYIVITDVTPVQYDQLAEGYGHRTERFSLIEAAKYHVNRRVFEEAWMCVGWSSWASRSIVDDYGIDPDRVCVIPPGVDMKQWRPVARQKSDRFRILFVGGEFGRKGGNILLEAFKRLPSRAELYLVTKTSFEQSARVHVVNDLGPNDPRLIELYGSSDVFVLPSLAETFGIAAVEASAMGLPVIASLVGGLPEIVENGETGFTVKPGDVDGLAEALLRLERDPELCLRMGRNGRARASQHFDAEANAQRLFELVLQAARE